MVLREGIYFTGMMQVYEFREGIYENNDVFFGVIFAA